MSHANAALTPRARLRLARLDRRGRLDLLDGGEDVHGLPAHGAEVGRPVPAEGPAGMADRSSSPAPQPDQDPDRVVKRRSCGCGGATGSARSRSPAGSGMPASTVHAVLVRCRINRLSRIDRVTGEPIRRYEHDHPGSLIHVDVTKFGNIPDGGGHALRRHGSKATRTGRATARPHRRARQALPAADRHRVPAHRDRRPLPGRLRRDLRRREGRHRHRRPATRRRLVRRPRRHRRTGPVRQRARPTGPTPGATPAPSSASPTSGPGPTGPRPTARSNASTAPWPTAGPTPASTTQKPNAEPPSPLAPLLQSPPSPLRHRRPTTDQPTDQPPWTSQLACACGGR